MFFVRDASLKSQGMFQKNCLSYLLRQFMLFPWTCLLCLRYWTFIKGQIHLCFVLGLKSGKRYFVRYCGNRFKPLAWRKIYFIWQLRKKFENLQRTLRSSKNPKNLSQRLKQWRFRSKKTVKWGSRHQRCSDIVVFLWILWNFSEHLRTTASENGPGFWEDMYI